MKAIILAAGFSSRMGTLKQVMPFDAKPMIRHVAEPFLTAGLELLVVVGHERERVKAVLNDLPVKFVVNEAPEDGMFSSVRLGCMHVPAGEGCLLTTCDCPGVRAETIHLIQHTLQAKEKQVVISSFKQRRGHPTGLPACLVDHIRQLPPQTPGLNSLWRERPEMVFHLNVEDPAVLRDFDRPEDLPSALVTTS